MTQDNEPQHVDHALFEQMAGMGVSLPMTGHQLGGLCFVLELIEESHAAILASPTVELKDRERVENLQDVVKALLVTIRQTMTYLSLAATATLAAAQDKAQNAPSTPSSQ